MLPELSEIAIKRKRFGLTQSELSKRAGVSQSLVAKIESGSVMPDEDNAKKIFDFFESLSLQNQLKASDFMAEKVISIHSDATLKDAARTMKRNSVSQLPVIDDGKNVGMVSEKIVLEAMNTTKEPKEASSIPVSNVMAEAMPVIKDDTPFKVVSALLELNAGVLVGRKGKIVGIITKADLLNAVLEKNSGEKI